MKENSFTCSCETCLHKEYCNSELFGIANNLCECEEYIPEQDSSEKE